MTHAMALRVLVRDGRALGVEYQHGGERVTAQAEREVVVSAGA